MQKLLFQDNQVHSTYSDGAFSLEEICKYNDIHDQLDLTITDHVNRLTGWFPRYVRHLKKLRAHYKNFGVRIGCEVKILDDGSLNTTEEILNAAEVVLGSVHHFQDIKTMTPQKLMEREYELTTLLAKNNRIDILAHPFSMGWRFHTSSPPVRWVEEIYNSCVRNGIKFEYNRKNAPQSVRDFVISLIARNEVGHLSFGSDMHDDLSELGCSGFKAQHPVSVLVTGAGAGVGQGIIKALKLSSIPLKIIAVDSSSLAAGLYTVDAAYLVPSYQERFYISRIIAICKKENVRLLFIGTDVELEVLSRNARRIKIESGAEVVVSNTRAVRIADDKWKTVEFLKKNGFPYADSCLPAGLRSFLKRAKFPLVVKPRVGARSVGMTVVRTRKELDSALAKTANPIIQEYLATEDSEFTCSAFFFKKKNYGVIVGQRWLRNGDTYKALFKRNPKLENFIGAVGEKLGLLGPCNFQLRQTRRGPVIFEINCRFSGTTGSASFLGFNVVSALLQIVCFKRPPYRLHAQEAYMLRYWNELFVDQAQITALGKNQTLPNPFSHKNIF